MYAAMVRLATQIWPPLEVRDRFGREAGRMRNRAAFREWGAAPPMLGRSVAHTARLAGSERPRGFAFVIFHHSKSTECLDFNLQGQSVP